MSDKLAPWELKTYVQSKTVLEHLANTDTNTQSEQKSIALQALARPWNDSDDMAERVLHMYLNECRSGRSLNWYCLTQQAFQHCCGHWVSCFDDILRARRKHGSRRQRAGLLGDWLALSHLQGSPLSFDMLFTARERHPMDTRSLAQTVPVLQNGVYRDVFDALYFQYHQTDGRWNLLLDQLLLPMMTRDIFDARVERTSEPVGLLLAGCSVEDSGLGLRDLLLAKHGQMLADVIVRAVVEGEGGPGERFQKWWRQDAYFVDSPILSIALYEYTVEHPDTREWLNMGTRDPFGVCHRVHAANHNVAWALRELAFYQEHPEDYYSKRMFELEMHRLEPAVRKEVLRAMKAMPEQFSALFIPMMKQTADYAHVDAEEIGLLLQSPLAQSLFVQSLLKGTVLGFVRRCVECYPALKDDLENTHLGPSGALPTIIMGHLVPQLSYADALSLQTMANTLGSEDNIISMYTMAIKGSLRCTPYSLNDEPQSMRFPM